MRSRALTLLALVATLLGTVAPANGIVFAQGRISGTERPWVAHIWTGGADAPLESYFAVCGGSLIAAQWILTAAHCVEGALDQMVVELGSSSPGDGDLIEVDGSWVNTKYSRTQMTNDIALLHLKTPATQKPVALTIADDSKLRKRMLLYGWGLDETGRAPDDLAFTAQDDLTTSASKYFRTFSTKTMIAAGRYDKKTKKFSGACNGDSGGPLVSTGTPKLLGIVSYGAVKCTADAPGVYMRVASFLSWIKTTRAMAEKEIAARPIDPVIPPVVVPPVVVPPVVPPPVVAPPTDLSVVARDASVLFTFTGPSVATGYRVRCVGNTGDTREVDISSSPYTMTGLRNGTSYVCSARTVTGDSLSAAVAVRVAIPAPVDPRMPSGLTLIRSNNSTLEVVFQSVVGATGYELLCVYGSDGTNKTFSTTLTRLTIATVEPRYSCVVRSITAGTASQWSSGVSG